MRSGTAGGELRHSNSLGNTVGKGESNLSVEHFSVSTTALLVLNGLNLQNVDAVSLSTMSRSHVSVGLGDSSSDRHVTVLSVHVVVPSAGIVLEPESVVLHNRGVLLAHLNEYCSTTEGGLPNSNCELQEKKIDLNISLIQRTTNLLNLQNLSTGLLHLAKHRNKVPETGLGDNVVGSKDLHLPQWSHGIILSRNLASDDRELLKITFGLGRHVNPEKM